MTTVELLSNILIDSYYDRYINRTNFNISRSNDNNGETFTRSLSCIIKKILNNLAIRDNINIDEIEIQHIDNSINTIINRIIYNNYYVDNDVLSMIYELIKVCNLHTNNNANANVFTLRDLRIIINNFNRNRINSCRRELFIIYILLKYSYHLQHSTHSRNNTTTTSIRNNLIQNTRNTIRMNNNTNYNTNINNTNYNNTNYNIAGYNTNYNNTNYNTNINNTNYNVAGYNTNYNIANITTALIRQNEPEYPGINSINGIVGPRGPTGLFDCIYRQSSTLHCEITCPFCRNKNDKVGWIKTNIIETCKICFYDNKIMYKSNECEHKICKHCVDKIIK